MVLAVWIKSRIQKKKLDDNDNEEEEEAAVTSMEGRGVTYPDRLPCSSGC